MCLTWKPTCANDKPCSGFDRVLEVLLDRSSHRLMWKLVLALRPWHLSAATSCASAASSSVEYLRQNRQSGSSNCGLHCCCTLGSRVQIKVRAHQGKTDKTAEIHSSCQASLQQIRIKAPHMPVPALACMLGSLAAHGMCDHKCLPAAGGTRTRPGRPACRRRAPTRVPPSARCADASSRPARTAERHSRSNQT